MSEEAAARALASASESGNSNAVEKVTRWLCNDEEIDQRFDPADIAEAVTEAAAGLRESGSDPKDALQDLARGLKGAPATALVSFFRKPLVQKEWIFGNIRLAPAETVLSRGDVPPEAAEQVAGASVAICVYEPGAGARGARRALQGLRSTLGALYLAGHALGADGRVGPIPGDEFAPSLYVGSPGQLGSLVAKMRIPESVALDIDSILAADEMRELVQDCIAPDFPTFVTERLRAAAAWLQIGFDALVYPDAVMALGIALEGLVGGQRGGDVIKIVSTRTAFLLREGTTRRDLALSALDWVDKTKSVYAERSSVAHGRYEEGNAAHEASNRSQFEDLVCRVALRFRQVGRNEGWGSEKDLQAWQELLEMG